MIRLQQHPRKLMEQQRKLCKDQVGCYLTAIEFPRKAVCRCSAGVMMVSFCGGSVSKAEMLIQCASNKDHRNIV